MLAPGTVLQNRYRIVRLIAGGGMGRVYEAVDEPLGKTVALKETFSSDEELRQAFEREARLLASLEHAALPDVSNHFTEDAGQFLVMQFIPGDDLKKLLYRKRCAFSPGEALPWADQLLDVLDYLHTQQPPIIHRDIKPENLKLTTRGKVMLLDFGLAKGANSSLPGFTLKYAPIEQITYKGTDVRSDLYALAATLYHLMTNEVPVDASARQEAAASKQPDPLRRADEINPLVPPAIADVLHRAMAVNREQRYASAAEMRRALHDAIGADQPTIIPPATEPEPLPSALPPQPLMQAAQKTASLRWPIINLIALSVFIVFVALFVKEKQAKLILIGHSDVVNSVAFSSDKITLASGSSDRTVKLWDVQTGKLLKTLREHNSPVNSVAFSPDGKILASGSDDNIINLWDVQTGTLWRALRGHIASVKSVAFSPDSRTLASGSKDNTINLWDVETVWDVQTGELPRTLADHSLAVYSVAFSPDGKILASGSDDNIINLWDVQTGTLWWALEGHSLAVYSVAFSPDGKILASGSLDQTVKLWDVQTGTLWRTLPGRYFSLLSLAFSPDGKILASGGTLASGSSDAAVNLWDVQTGELLPPLPGLPSSVYSVAFSLDGKTLATGRADHTVELWDRTIWEAASPGR